MWGQGRPSECHKSLVLRAKTATGSCLTESEKGRSSFVGVAGLAGLFLSTLCLQYLTSSPCLPTVTLMEPEGAGRERGWPKTSWRNTSLTSLCLNSDRGYAKNVLCTKANVYMSY